MRILVVEDEKDLARIIKNKLEKEHYSVDTAYNGEKAIDLTIVNKYDLIILDLMLPGKNGLEVLQELRDWGDDTPVLVLTARDSLENKVKGLNMGADDYLTKPFAFEELIARIRTILRRGIVEESNIIENGELVIDTVDYKVTRAGEEIELSSKEYSLLEYLVRNRGHVLTRNQIEEHVWGHGEGNNSNIVDVYIRFLRRKIDEGYETKYIETVRGKGYKMKIIEGE